MCCNDNNSRNTSCLGEVLEKIIVLQQNADIEDCTLGCAKPFLGNNVNQCLNTRPISLYCCCADNRWTFPANVNGCVVECDVFRIESLNDCCATVRCLVRSEMGGNETYTATEDFAIIDLNCVSALKCFADTNVRNI